MADLEELEPVVASLAAGESQGGSSSAVPVRLESRVTELGILELWCVSREGRRWKLEYEVRERPPAEVTR